MRPLWISMALMATMISCQNGGERERWPYGVNYEVFVMAFADGNGDGKGDLRGLTDRLDYLKDLGVGGVWLMPIMPSPSYHKYDVVDYKAIDPDYGTREDFKKFVAKAHELGIQVIIDLIMNHTGSGHPWFQEAIKGKRNPFRDYYIWADRDSVADVIAKKEVSLDSDNITQWHPVNGDTDGEYYYGFFYSGMPDLNFDNPQVRREFVDIGKFWLTEMGVDGFRLDAAKHIFPTERAADNHAFWEWFRAEMQMIKHDVYMVGEVWSPAEEVAPYLRGIPALFNFDMGYAITSVVLAGADTINLVKRYREINDYYKAVTPEYIDATFLRNHDQNRILSEMQDHEGRARLAASILFTFPGTPYVYYGEEIGMKGRKPDPHIREPFIWDEGGLDPMQTAWATPKYSTDATVVPLRKQKTDPDSFYNFYKNWIAYRNENEILSMGDVLESRVDIPNVISLERAKGSEKRLGLHNVLETTIRIPLEDLYGFQKIDFATDKNVMILDGYIELPGFGSVVLKNE